ncbi:peptidase M16 family protein [Cavenderia fasciculata]|uniref:Presequence protease, mitochondrial n=1 Tax=Cavenderia fasciculata TaxID=261658 RepID=F4Q925_CACFS|nr:peptidase M16 family protein [Cavenderia fasciculata]EGG15194.1 peptidase M16 family protein [Cavenderia fasciculata]|eukprot:XP_004351914.1 peptidase M16 family protein [Cavenderia fasciculata]
MFDTIFMIIVPFILVARSQLDYVKPIRSSDHASKSKRQMITCCFSVLWPIFTRCAKPIRLCEANSSQLSMSAKNIQEFKLMDEWIQLFCKATSSKVNTDKCNHHEVKNNRVAKVSFAQSWMDQLIQDKPNDFVRLCRSQWEKLTQPYDVSREAVPKPAMEPDKRGRVPLKQVYLQRLTIANEKWNVYDPTPGQKILATDDRVFKLFLICNTNISIAMLSAAVGRSVLNRVANVNRLRSTSSNLVSGCLTSYNNNNNNDSSSNKCYYNVPKNNNSNNQYCRQFSNTSITRSSEPITKPSSTTRSRGKERERNELKKGDRLHGYVVLEVRDVPERQFRTYTLEHEKTGAKHLHIDCEDKNNIFSVTFRTTPMDSTGVAHILEHTTLCGSKKYPVRDPFFNMLKRSLNTYMNAWTAPDHTSYPFGTQDETDYYNLLGVYLDATFFPNLAEHDFRQEGHRLEFEKNDDPSTPLQYKGIVFNEMKGALSDPSSYFAEIQQQLLYPGTTYSHNSGGEPKDIPTLSYEQLKDFHQKHYHPSNSHFFTYGDLPLENHLKYIQENVLYQFDRTDVSSTAITNVKRWSEPKSIKTTCPPSTMETDRKYKFSLSVLHNNNSDIYESLVLNILSTLLLRGTSTPMYQSLLQSGLALDYTPGTGFEEGLFESAFSVGGVGIREQDVAKVQETILETMAKVEKEGFDEKNIESVLHQYEYSQKDVSASFGIKLAGVVHSLLVHNLDPVERLHLNQYVERFRQQVLIEKKPILQQKIREILDNPHRLNLTMVSDDSLQQKEKQDEIEKLAKINSKLSIEEKKKIVEQALDLQSRQNLAQDVSCLPRILISDIEKKQEKIPFIDQFVRDTPLRLLDLPTNGITYFRSIIDISTMPDNLKIYLPFYSNLMTSMGAGKFDDKQLDTEMNLYTGRFGSSPMISTSPFDLNVVGESLYIRSACLNKNIEKMFDLWNMILLDNHWENPDLIKILMGQIQSSIVENIPSSGLSYASLTSASNFTRATHLSEQWSGLSHVALVNQLVSSHDYQGLIEKLLAINQFITDRSLMRSCITTEKDTIPLATEKLSHFLGHFQSRNTMKTNTNQFDSIVAQNAIPKYFGIPSAVNYISKAYQGVAYTHQDSARLQVLSKVLGEYLHKEIREKGGAYGGGVSYDSGVIGFYSYRDPNLQRTIDAFGQSIQWSVSDKITTENIENAQLSIFSAFDAPESPSSKGLGEWSRGITHEMKQQRRDRLFNIDKQQLEQVAEKYLINQTNYTTILGKQDQEIKNEKNFNYKDI